MTGFRNIFLLTLVPRMLAVLVLARARVKTGAIYAGEMSYAAHLLGEGNRGMVFGLLSAVNGIGGFVSCVTAGILWTVLFPNAAFGHGAILAIVATVALATSRVGKTMEKQTS